MLLSQLLTISISRNTAAVSQAGFGTPMILGSNKTAPGVGSYGSLTDVLAEPGITTSTDEYKAAQKIFGQSPHPTTVKIGKALVKVAQIDTLTPDTSTQAIEHFQVTINGVLYDFTSDSSPTAAEVVTGLSALINADSNCAMAATGSTTLILTAKVAGQPSTVVGTLRMALVHTTANVGVVESLAALSLTYDDDWYCLISTFRSNADILQIAAYIEGLPKIFGVSSNAVGMYDPASTTDIAYLLKASSYFHTFCFYSADTANFPEAAIAGQCLPLTPGSETWAFKTLAGSAVDNLTGAQINALKAKNCNYYVLLGGKNVTLNGVVSGGEYIDVIRLIDLITARMMEAVYGSIVNSTKIPYTNGGISVIQNNIAGVLKANQKTGGIAPDDVDSSGNLVPGFATSFPKVSSISANDRAARVLTGGTFTARLAGAIQALTLNGTITV